MSLLILQFTNFPIISYFCQNISKAYFEFPVPLKYIPTIALLHQLRNQFLHLCQLLAAAFLVGGLTVGRGGHSPDAVKGLGKDQGIIIAAGQGNTLYGIVRGL